MATWYISPSGSNTTGNGSYATPWATVQKAHDSASGGDAIICKNGTYSVIQTCTFSKSLSVYAETDGGVIFDYAGTSRGSVFVGSSGCSGILVRGITFLNSAVTNAVMFRQYTPGATDVLRLCKFVEIALGSDSAVVRTGGDPAGHHMIVESCLFDNCKKTSGAVTCGIGFLYSSYRGTLTIRNSCVFSDVASASQISHLFLDYNSANNAWHFHNNIFECRSGASIAFRQYSGSTIASATNNCYDGISGYPAHATNILADPLFWDAANGDFRIRSKDGSGNPNPVIEAGVML